METNKFSFSQILRFVTPFAVLAAIIAALTWRTHNFSAFTSYSYQLVKTDPIGKPVPSPLFILMEDSSRAELNALGNHYTLVGIVYLKCQVVCPIINQRLYEIYQDLELDSSSTRAAHASRPKSISDKLRLLTLSFDRKRDSVSDLKAYKNQFFGGHKSNDGKSWGFAVMDEPQESLIRKKLSQMGFWLFESEAGMYNHSPYLYLIGPNGIIKNIYDPGKLSNQEIIAQLHNDVH